MASVQELETMVKQLQEQVAFTMKVVSVTIGMGHPLDPRGVQQATIPLERLYREVKYAGGQIMDIKVSRPIEVGQDSVSPQADGDCPGGSVDAEPADTDHREAGDPTGPVSPETV